MKTDFFKVNAMFTINYKGFHIHGHCNKPECRVNSCGKIHHFKSIHAAKCYITRVMIAAHDAAMVQFAKAAS